ncbi:MULTISPECIES: hypothetical protein [unclassified Myroides]|uniref:hypothetical protein n=1 Tax=unclassified Myroides TaxID=2642485 RepID=UPI0031011B24
MRLLFYFVKSIPFSVNRQVGTRKSKSVYAKGMGNNYVDQTIGSCTLHLND